MFIITFTTISIEFLALSLTIIIINKYTIYIYYDI